MVEPLNEADIHATELLVSEDPVVICPGIDNRAFWDRIGSIEQAAAMLKKACRLSMEDLPSLSDELYLDYSKTGNRRRYETECFSRRDRLLPLTVAECLENQGRFLPAIEYIIKELCKEKTWVLPAHDPHLGNFNGEWIDIDLFSAMLGINLTTIWQLLSSKLSRETKELIETNVRRRIIEPSRMMIQGERTYNWWLTHDNNWNPVCLAGVMGCALMMEESKESRAFFITAAEKYSRMYIEGFCDDGCCSEGVGYWNFGFTNYMVLARVVSLATKEKVDLYDRPHIPAIVEYGVKIEIINSVYPAFADCRMGISPSPIVLEFFSRRGVRIPRQPAQEFTTKLFESQLYEFASFASLLTDQIDSVAAADTTHITALRTHFEDNDILICRPGTHTGNQLGLALKAGHNDEMHNHNDVGSYVIAVNNETVLLDLGSEVYTRKTFSSRRYESAICNSYGHPVPVVAGTLQQDGRKYQGHIVQREFSDERDTIELDIREAYAVPSLVELQRTFVYSREGTGMVTITDKVRFSTPEQFETALITMGSVELLDSNHIRIQSGKEGVEAVIESSDGDFEILTEEIDADLRVPGELTRIGIRLRKAAMQAAVKVTIRRLPDCG